MFALYVKSPMGLIGLDKGFASYAMVIMAQVVPRIKKELYLFNNSCVNPRKGTAIFGGLGILISSGSSLC